MSNVVNVANFVDPEVSTGTPLTRNQWTNQSDKQSFSEAFATSLKRPSQAAGHSQSHTHGRKSATTVDQSEKQSANKIHADANCKDKTRCNESKAPGSSLPGDGKRLQAKKGDDTKQVSSATQDPAVVQAAESPNAATIQELPGAVSNGSEAASVTSLLNGASTGNSVTDIATESAALAGTAVPENVTNNGVQAVTLDQPATQSEQASLTDNTVISGGQAQNGSQYVATANTNDAIQGQNNSPISIPGQPQANVIPTLNSETPSATVSPQNQILQGSSAQQHSIQVTGLPPSFSDQIKQWVAAKLNNGQTNNGMQGQGNPSHSTSGNSASNTVSSSAPSIAVEDSRRFNNHLLFEKFLNQPGVAAARSPAANSANVFLNTDPLNQGGGTKDTQSSLSDSTSNLVVTSMDMRSTPGNTGNSILPMLSIPTPVTHSGWAQEVGHKLMFMLNQDIQQAQLQMNPRHLGPLEVRISLGHEQQVNVSFVTHNAMARDALDGAMHRLRDMLGQQGLSLSDFNVSQENFKNPHYQSPDKTDVPLQSYDDPVTHDMKDLEELSPIQGKTLVSDRMVDYFA